MVSNCDTFTITYVHAKSLEELGRAGDYFTLGVFVHCG